VRPTVENRVRTIEIRGAGDGATLEGNADPAATPTRLRPAVRENSAG